MGIGKKFKKAGKKVKKGTVGAAKKTGDAIIDALKIIGDIGEFLLKIIKNAEDIGGGLYKLLYQILRTALKLFNVALYNVNERWRVGILLVIFWWLLNIFGAYFNLMNDPQYEMLRSKLKSFF